MFVPTVAFATAAGAAKGGNGENAQACQKNGWQSLFRPDGSPFADEGECVSYGAHGGTASTTSACFDSNQTTNDARLIGPIDTASNTTLYQTNDGTCGGFLAVADTVVAANVAEADTKCQAIATPLGTSGSYQHFGFSTAPANWWFCGG